MKRRTAVFIILLAAAFTVGATLNAVPAAGDDRAIPVNVPFSTTTIAYQDIGSYLQDLYKYSIGIGALLAMTMIVIGGIQWTLSAGNIGRQSDAKDRILSAIYGLVLLLGAFLILYTISPDLVSLRVLSPDLPSPPPPTGEPPPGPTGVIMRNFQWASQPAPPFTLQWRDNCPKEQVCNFQIFAALATHDENGNKTGYDGTTKLIRVFGDDEHAGGSYSYEIEPEKIALDQIWRIAAEADNGNAVTQLETEPAKYELDPHIIVKKDDRFPPVPPRPIVKADKPRRITITDQSTSEVRFTIYLAEEKEWLIEDLPLIQEGKLDLYGFNKKHGEDSVALQRVADYEYIPNIGHVYEYEIAKAHIDFHGVFDTEQDCMLFVIAEDRYRQFDLTGLSEDTIIDLGAKPPNGWGYDFCQHL